MLADRALCFVLACIFACSTAKLLQDENNVSVLITSYGYTVEFHQAQTDDGYLLTLHHIPHGINNTKPTKGAVLLQHGLTDSSAGWVMNPPSLGLAYILADAGYDVWLGNNRGNGYSMTNINFPPENAAFWDFCWDQMATSDFPTNINYVLQATNQKKISYIGHSEGTIQAFAGLVSNPNLAEKLNVYIALAPVAYVGHLSVSLIKFLASIDGDAILEYFGIKELTLAQILHQLLPDLCREAPNACEFGGTAIYGQNSYLNESFLALYTDYEPFPTSVKNIIHWAQSVRANTFSKFDYGRVGNIQHYGQATPPAYDLSKFPKNLPTVLFTGALDGLADVADVKRLLSELPITPKVYNRDDYGHLDPLLGDHAYMYTYPQLLAELAKYSTGN